MMSKFFRVFISCYINMKTKQTSGTTTYKSVYNMKERVAERNKLFKKEEARKKKERRMAIRERERLARENAEASKLATISNTTNASEGNVSNENVDANTCAETKPEITEASEQLVKENTSTEATKP